MIRALAFAVAYAAAVALAYAAGALLLRHGIDSRLAFAIALFVAGAFVAGFLASLLVRWWGRRRPPTARFALAVILLAALTAGFDAFFLFLQYATYFAQWWQPAFSIPWMFQSSFTGLGVTFFFVSLGLPLLLPFGLPVLFGAAWWLARR